MVFDHGWDVNDHVRLARDADGDHRTDLVGFGPDGVYVARAQGEGFANPTVALGDLGANVGWHRSTSIRTLADINGDGRLDLVGIGPFTVRASLANASGGYAATTTVWSFDFAQGLGWDVNKHAFLLGDVNGDGKDDVVAINDWGVYASVSNGTSFLGVQMWLRGFTATNTAWDATRHVAMLADTDNDGFADLVEFADDGVYVARSTGLRFEPPIKKFEQFGYSTSAGSWRIGNHVRAIANLNGDAYPDIIGMGPSGVVVALGKKGGFETPTMWSTEFGDAAGWVAGKHPRLIGDVDGDGRDDVVGINDDHVLLALSTGAALAAPSTVLDDFSFHKGWLAQNPRMLADIDGDGALELVGFGNDAIYWDRLVPVAPAVPAGWDTPACAESRLRPPAPRTCEGPWQYTETQRCFGPDSSCPLACTAYQACEKWENGAVAVGKPAMQTSFLGSGTRQCTKLCNNVGCSTTCNGTITQPTAQCTDEATTKQTEYVTKATNGVNGENTFDSAAAQAARVNDVKNTVKVTPDYIIKKTNIKGPNPGPGGTITTWNEQWGCQLLVTDVAAKVAVNDACECKDKPPLPCEHDCNSAVKYTDPSQKEPTSPQVSQSTCLTHDDLPQTTAGQIQSKFEALWTTYQAAPGLPIASETLTRAIVTRLKLMYELFGDRLIDQHVPTDQVHRAIALYAARPNDNPSCMLDVDAPAPPAGCTNPAVTTTRGDLIRCQRLLGQHAADGAASLASTDCTALLTGYLGLVPLTADDAACGGPHLREVGVKTVLDLEHKQLGVINSAPATLGALPRQLWLLDSWYAVSRAAGAAGVYSTADQQRRDTSFLLGEFWSHVRKNTDADAQLTTASQATTSAQAESALGLSAAASRGFEQSVVSALFTVPLQIQPENVTLNRPPLRGLPVLALLGDALQPLVDDLDSLAIFHDIACQFRDCRAPTTNTPSRRAWTILADLESSALGTAVTGNTHNLAGWSTVFPKLVANQAVLTEAVTEAVSGGGGLAGAGTEGEVDPLARPLWVLYNHARAFHDHYEATGQFESTAPNLLQGSLLEQDQHFVVTGLRNRASKLTDKVTSYRNGLVAVLQATIAAMQNGATLQNLTDQRLLKAEEMNQKARNLEGLRAAGEDEADAFGSLAASFADIQPSIDAGVLIPIGDTVVFTVNGLDGRFNGTLDLPKQAVRAVTNLVPGNLLVVQTQGSWTPTCALSAAKFLGAGGDNPIAADLSGAEIGPEGYAITNSGGTFQAHSSGHAFSLDVSTGMNTQFCVNDDIFGDVYGFEAKVCTFAEIKGTASLSSSSNGGDEARSTASFSAGLRLRGTPFPNAPVGSLLVVLADPVTKAIRDVKVVHSGGTSILVESSSTAYFIVNDRQCTTAPVLHSLTVTARTMSNPLPVASAALEAMADVLANLRQKQQLYVDQGALLPSQATGLRQDAGTALQTRLGNIAVGALPAPLTSLFDAFVTHEIVAVERRIQITAIERSLDLDLIALRTINDELRAGEAQGRLQRLVPQWILRDLPHDTLRKNLVDLLSVTRDHLKPILELWYPSALADDRIGLGIDALLDAEIDSSLVSLATSGVTFVDGLLDAYDDATFGAKGPADQLPLVALRFERPGTVHTNESWRAIDSVRSARVWDAIDHHEMAHFEVRPDDFYTLNGGDAVLQCTELVPLIRIAGLHVVRPDGDDNGTINGLGRKFHGLGAATQSFVTPEGPRTYQLADAMWQHFDLSVRYGEATSALNDFLAAPHQTRPIGLSATGSFDVDFSVLSDLPDAGHFDADDPFKVTEVILVLQLDSRFGSAPGWVDACNASL